MTPHAHTETGGGGRGGTLVLDETVAALTTNVTGLDMETTQYIRARAAPTARVVDSGPGDDHGQGAHGAVLHEQGGALQRDGGRTAGLHGQRDGDAGARAGVGSRHGEHE